MCLNSIFTIRLQPESHHSFELDFLDVESHSHIPDHDPPGYQEADSEQESPPEHARNAWQQHLGDEVRGGYTVQDLDGTLTHYSYSKIRPQVDGDSYY